MPGPKRRRWIFRSSRNAPERWIAFPARDFTLDFTRVTRLTSARLLTLVEQFVVDRFEALHCNIDVKLGFSVLPCGSSQLLAQRGLLQQPDDCLGQRRRALWWNQLSRSAAFNQAATPARVRSHNGTAAAHRLQHNIG